LACPEQYDAFLDGKQVGYLRLRHGTFRVDYPDCGEETIYVGHPEGDGIFLDEERDGFLRIAVAAILKRMTGTKPPGTPPDVEYEVDHNGWDQVEGWDQVQEWTKPNQE